MRMRIRYYEMIAIYRILSPRRGVCTQFNLLVLVITLYVKEEPDYYFEKAFDRIADMKNHLTPVPDKRH